MPPLYQLLPLLIVIPLIAFWLWMFRDMLNHDDLPNLMTRDAKTDWTLVFLIFNVFAAAYYYSLIYRNRR